MEEAYTFKYIKKTECTGCEACANVCPMGAMQMQQDESGFYYPKTNYNKCVGCKMCIGVCHRAKGMQMQNLREIETFAGFSHDEEVVYNSSSGGLFRTLADEFIRVHPEGKICAVVWNDDFKGVHHELGGKELLDEMQRSKYVQSRKNSVYVRVKECLEKKIPVMFVGCPCEVAALTLFLGREYENLFKIDLVCQGPTAPAVLEKYVDNLEKKYKANIESINLRLPAGANWIPQWSDIRFYNKKRYVRAFYETDLGVGVHYMQRESCFSCEIRGKNRFSDITLGDYHGISPKATYYNSKGTSILCVNTAKGKKILDLVKGKVYLEKVEYSMVERHNKRLTEPRVREKEDMVFLNTYKNKGLKHAIKKAMPWRKRVRYYLPTALSNRINGYKGCERNEG